MRHILGLIFALGIGAAGIAAPPVALAADSAGSELFEKRIRPLLAEHCYQCHGPKKQESGLAVNSVATLRKGGDRGPLIVPGAPDESLIVAALKYADDDLKMPPRGKLADEQIAAIAEWIKLGAPAPDEGVAAAVQPASEFNLAERRQHWAYQPVARPAVPAVTQPAWAQSPIDRFIWAKLEGAGLTPSSPAERRTLLRRVTFDLIGLPPSRQEATAFLADEAPDAYERLIDRLLASPHYGERWARHWLDVVRYSETLGFEFDYDLHNAWRYRDYVIRALNADLPYDQFVTEHLAGDLVTEPRRHPLDGTNESILATGFWWMLEGKQTPVDIRQDQCDRIDNQLDVLGKAFLGQTIACARCHDHKFDAIATRDYYALAGYLISSRYQQAYIDPPEARQAIVTQLRSLRAEIERRALGTLLPAWRKTIAQAGRYLLAAAEAKGQDEAGIAAVARQASLDAPQLAKWVKALEHEALSEVEHPLYAWKKLTGEKRPRDISEADIQSLHGQLSQQTLGGQQGAKFPLSGWFATGDPIDDSPVEFGLAVVGEHPRRPIARFSAGGLDSGVFSAGQQVELRSPSFVIDKKYVHLRLAGRQARVNLVIDGYTLIMNPMYGKLTAAPAGELFVWRTMPVDRWVGRRAFFEISDSTISPYGLNPPASAARMPVAADGYIAVEQIVLSDEPQPPAVPNMINRVALGRASDALREGGAQAEHALDRLAAEYGRFITLLVDEWFPDFSRRSHNAEIYLPLVNWLLETGLLDGPENAGRPGGGESLANLITQYQQLEQALAAPQRAPALADGTGEDEHVLLRGNWRTPGERAPRDVPQVLNSSSLKSQVSSLSGGSGRLDLARKLVDRSNPLLPRVIVNRLWQHHFGAGIIRTPDDFGRMGQPPTHPELLDYLASELVDSGWSLKTLQRRMVTGSVYRQSSGPREKGTRDGGQGGEISAREKSDTQTLSFLGGRAAVSTQYSVPSTNLDSASNPKSHIPNTKSIDPDNRLLWHLPARRLEAEAIRDSVLAISGRLSNAMHGPSVLPFVTPYMEGRGKPQSGPLDGEGRRSIYINARRNFLTPLLLAFDYPVTFTPIGRRGTSAIAGQALTLMNDPFVVGEAGRWAERLTLEAGSGAEQRIAWLYETAFARPPTADEAAAAIDFLQSQSLRYGSSSEDQRVWADLCHVLINTKEFIFVE